MIQLRTFSLAAIRSLQFRLIAAFAVVLAVVITGVSAYAAARTHAETVRFSREVEESRAQKVEQLIQDAYDANRDWDQVRYTIDQAASLLGWRVVMYDYSSGSILADTHGEWEEDDGEKVIVNGRPVGTITQLQHGPRFFRRDVYLGDEQIGMMLVMDDSGYAVRPRGSSFNKGFVPQRAQPAQGLTTAPAVPDPRLPSEFLTPPASVQTQNQLIADELAPEPKLQELESSFRRSLVFAGAAAGAAGILLVGMFTRQALAPVRSLTIAARSLGKGDLSYRVDVDNRDEIGELARTFNEMAAGLEAATTERRALTADVAHELRTPLTNIKGYLEAIRDGVLQPDPETIGVIYDQTVHLSRLVEDLRLVAVADAGRLQLFKEQLKLDDAAGEAVAAFGPRAAEKQVALRFSAEPRLPSASLDRTRIRQVVANLVENALTHTPHGGEVVVGVTSPSEGRLRLTVEDSGPGIPADKLDRVFDQFYRIDPSRSRSTGGAGLGLTIVKKLVEAHGGTVRAGNRPLGGATFIVELAGDPPGS